MLHATASESKQQDAATPSPSAPAVTPTLHPGAPSLSAANDFGRSGLQTSPTTIRQHFTRLQQTVGNQAVLRILSRSGPTLQTKLAVNRPGDQFEQEADRVANQVMGMPQLGSRALMLGTSGAPQLHRKCGCGGSSEGGGLCSECAEKEELLRSPIGPSPVSEAPPLVHDVIRSQGEPLDSATREFFEPRFGRDLSKVRVHRDVRAASSALSVNAIAYTVGRDVVFGAGQYSPTTSAGRHLIAHELTHVLQQGAAQAPGDVRGSVSSRSLLQPPQAALQRQTAVQEDNALEALDSMTAAITEGMWGDPPDDVGLLLSALGTLLKQFGEPKGPMTHAATARSLLAVLKKLRLQEESSPRDTDDALMREDVFATIDQPQHNVPWTSSRPHNLRDLQRDIPGFDLDHEQDWILAAETGPAPQVSTPSTPPVRSQSKRSTTPSAASPQTTVVQAAPSVPDKVVLQRPPFNGALVIQLPGNTYAKVDADRYAVTENVGRASAWSRYLFGSVTSVIVIGVSAQGDALYYVASLDTTLTQPDLRPQTLKDDPTMMGARGRILSTLPGSYGVMLVRLADDSLWAPTRAGLTASIGRIQEEQKRGGTELGGETITAAGLTADWRVGEIRKLIENHWTDDADEKNIISIIAQTPAMQAAELLRRLSEDKTGTETLLEALDRVVDGENNQLLHEALSILRMKALGPQQSPKSLTDAPVLPWHDVMGFFEDSATFSVTVTEKGKYRIEYEGGSRLLSSKDFAAEIKALPFNIFVGGQDFEPNATVIIHDYDTGRFVPVMVQELAGYEHAKVRKFLGDVATIASFAIPVSEATTVAGKIAVYTFERVLPALILVVDENRLNIVEWWPNWGPKILKYVDIAKAAVAIYGVARFALSSAEFFRNWKQVRAMRKALDGAAINADAERVAAALERQSDLVIEQAEKLQNAEPSAKAAAQTKVDVPEGQGVSPQAPPKTAPQARKFDFMEGVNQETKEFLNSESNRAFRNALEQNPLAAQVLKSCRSFCYPKFATAEQIARLEKILEDGEQQGFAINTRRLNQALRDPSIQTVEDLDRAVDAIEQQLKSQKELAEVIREAVGEPAAKITEFTPNRTTAEIDSKLRSIETFRRNNNLPAFSQSGSSGSVALAEVEGRAYFGMNSTLNESLYSLSVEERRLWFKQLKSQGKLKGLNSLSEAQFLNHAEAEALIKAYKDSATKSLPEKLDLFVDRQTCPSCRDYLGELAGSLGVKEVHIYYLNQTQPPVIIKGR